jgi:uncharacterized protein
LNKYNLTIFLFLFLTPVAIHSEVEGERSVPKLTQRVTDLSGLFTAEDSKMLDRRLRGLEQSNKIQMAILVVPDTGLEAIEQYSMKVAEQWKLGSAKDDNGLLLLIDTGARKMRIEVGYGLEGMLPDLRTKRIIDNIIIPGFKSKTHAFAITEAIDAIAALSAGETDTFEVLTQSNQEDELDFSDFFFMMILIVIFIMKKGNGVHFLGMSSFGISSGSGGGGFDSFSGGGGGFGGGGASGSW